MAVSCTANLSKNIMLNSELSGILTCKQEQRKNVILSSEGNHWKDSSAFFNLCGLDCRLPNIAMPYNVQINW